MTERYNLFVDNKEYIINKNILDKFSDSLLCKYCYDSSIKDNRLTRTDNNIYVEADTDSMKHIISYMRGYPLTNIDNDILPKLIYDAQYFGFNDLLSKLNMKGGSQSVVHELNVNNDDDFTSEFSALKQLITDTINNVNDNDIKQQGGELDINKDLVIDNLNTDNISLVNKISNDPKVIDQIKKLQNDNDDSGDEELQGYEQLQTTDTQIDLQQGGELLTDTEFIGSFDNTSYSDNTRRIRTNFMTLN
jgi:hypothetical protein